MNFFYNSEHRYIDDYNYFEIRLINRLFNLQADVEISFEVNKKNIGEAEVLEKLTDPQILCSQKGTSVKSGLGPFGLLVFASKGLQEFTSVFFRVFRFQNKNLVLFCSDQSRFVLNPLVILT